jgi:hypothetical protein
MIIQFLYQLVEVFKVRLFEIAALFSFPERVSLHSVSLHQAYFGNEFNEESLKDNFVLVYELFDGR